jgi:ADP-ribose pyrophosphatase YjhB (NUDIX family)
MTDTYESGPGEPSLPTAITRDFTVATFVVQDGRVLLLWHRNLQRWLPPGGHIEPNELPDEAATREVREEAGIAVELVGERGVPVERPRQLVRPAGVQLETIAPNHEHVDLIYYARPVERQPAIVGNAESESIGWYTLAEMGPIGVTREVTLWATRAVQAVGGKRPRTRTPRAR